MTEATHPANGNGSGQNGNGHDEKSAGSDGATGVPADPLQQRVEEGPKGGASTWYDVLEVTIEASDADVKKAYDRALALVEGRNIGGYLMLDPLAAESARADVEAAFKVLGDADRRAAYDAKLREQGRAPKAATPPPAATPAPTPPETPSASAPAVSEPSSSSSAAAAPLSSSSSSSSSSSASSSSAAASTLTSGEGDVFAPRTTAVTEKRPGDSLDTANDEDVFEDRASREAREAREMLAVADHQQQHKPPPSSAQAPLTQPMITAPSPASLQKPPPLPPRAPATTTAETAPVATSTPPAATTSKPPTTTSKPPVAAGLKFLAPTVDNDPLAAKPTAVGIRFEAPKTEDGPVPSAMAAVTVPSGAPIATSTNVREIDPPKLAAPSVRATSAPIMDAGDPHSAPTVPVFRTPIAAAMMGDKTEPMSLRPMATMPPEASMPAPASTPAKTPSSSSASSSSSSSSSVKGTEGVGDVHVASASAPAASSSSSTGLPDGDIHGSVIRELREKKGMSLEQLAEATKIRKPYLKAIEESDAPNLPARVYLRGFLTQIARVLKVDKARLADGYLSGVDKAGGPGGGSTS